MFTTVRELVENSLDAAESISELPDIAVSITEYSEEEHNQRHGIHQSVTAETSTSSKKESMYYDVKCRDNGCGIAVEHVGQMLGKVLSGSKHGVRQTRGKFGLGAKMVDYSIVLWCNTARHSFGPRSRQAIPSLSLLLTLRPHPSIR